MIQSSKTEAEEVVYSVTRKMRLSMKEESLKGRVRAGKHEVNFRSQKSTHGQLCFTSGCRPRSAGLKGMICLAAARFPRKNPY